MFFREARLDKNFGYCKVYLPKTNMYIIVYLHKFFIAEPWTMFISEMTVCNHFSVAYHKTSIFDPVSISGFRNWYEVVFPGEIKPSVCVHFMDVLEHLNEKYSDIVDEIKKVVRTTFNDEIEIEGIPQLEEKRELPRESDTKQLIHEAYEYWYSKNVEIEVEKQLRSKKRRLMDMIKDELGNDTNSTRGSRESLRGSVIHLNYGDK